MQTRVIWGFLLVGAVLLILAVIAILNEAHRLLDPWLEQVATLVDMLNANLSGATPPATPLPTPTVER